MHVGVRTGSVIHSARTVGQPPHMFPQRRVGTCTRYRSAESSPDVTVRRTLGACNVARYNEP